MPDDIRIRMVTTENALANVGMFSDWLMGRCAASPFRVTLPARMSSETAPEDVSRKPVADLLRLSLDPGQPRAVRLAALTAMTDRYLADNADYMAHLAEQVRRADQCNQPKGARNA